MTHPTEALRLVPVEPTWDQLVAMRDCCAELSGIEADSETMLTALYRAALAAASASPPPEGGGQLSKNLGQLKSGQCSGISGELSVWRTDFENAPKDGSVFMVGYDDEAAKKAGLFENKDRVYEARWNDIQSTWSARNGFILHSDATHWMPLPAAPTGDRP